MKLNGQTKTGGFTLVKGMVGVIGMGMAIVLTRLYAGHAEGLATDGVAREERRAIQILEEKLETTRLYTWDQITSGSLPGTFSGVFLPGQAGASGMRYEGAVTISPAPLSEAYAADMRLVTFRVEWTSHSVRHQRVMSTLVSKYGLHNYNYTYQ